jgi:hypothetical protein
MVQMTVFQKVVLMAEMLDLMTVEKMDHKMVVMMVDLTVVEMVVMMVEKKD